MVTVNYNKHVKGHFHHKFRFGKSLVVMISLIWNDYINNER
jgi:hypothetical protein